VSRPFASLTRSFAKGTPTAPVPAQVSVLLRVVVVLLAGAAVGLSWQPYGLWPLLLVGIPAFTLRPGRSGRLLRSGSGICLG